MISNDHTADNFVQEYLYIEEYPFEVPQKADTNQLEEEKVERGVIIIDLL